MAASQSANLTNPETAMAKTKGNKANKSKATRTTTKKTTPGKTVTAKAQNAAAATHTTKSSAPLASKTFICGCVDDCRFKVRMKDMRMALGRPEFNEDSVANCNCMVHYKCAKIWAQAHDELPVFLPCGCPMTPRGTDFWARAVPGRLAEKEKNNEK
jgi:hypothetical protein